MTTIKKEAIKNTICDNFKNNFSCDDLIKILNNSKIHIYECIECSDPIQGLDKGCICINHNEPNIIGSVWKEIK